MFAVCENHREKHQYQFQMTLSTTAMLTDEITLGLERRTKGTGQVVPSTIQSGEYANSKRTKASQTQARTSTIAP